MIVAKERKVEPIIFDTTLREGFQTPGGIGASLDERVYVTALIQRYAHWVELGMPANNVDYGIISAIRDRFLEENYDVGIAVLARCNPKDIGRSEEVMENYPNNLIHLFVGTSNQHRGARFSTPKKVEEYEELIRSSVGDAASRATFSRVMFSPEDSYRTWDQDHKLLIDFIKAAKEGYDNGNTKVGRGTRFIFNLPDTVGYSTNAEFGRMIRHVQRVFGNTVELSIHGHNDIGTAQSQVFDVYERYGIQWLQTTFGQLGERNGIGSTDRTVKILADRGYLTDPRIVSEENLKELDPVTKAVLWALGRDLPDEHLDRINISTAGIHSDLAIKNPLTYHIHTDRFGSEPTIELGPTSGTTQVMDLLNNSKVSYNPEGIPAFTDKLKEEANKRKSPLSVTHIIYEALIAFNGKRREDGLQIAYFDITTTSYGRTKLYVEGTVDGSSFSSTHESKGPVEVTMELLSRIINEHRNVQDEISLVDYKTRIIPVIGPEYLKWKVGSSPKIPQNIGKDAHQAISVTFKNGSGTYQGWARHENSTIAEVGAVVDGMSKMYALQKWMNPGNSTGQR